VSEVISGRRIVVTGGLGFIGSRVVSRLVARNAEVVVPYRDGERVPEGVPGTYVVADLEDAGEVSALMQGAAAVVHLAARSGGIQFQEASQVDVFAENQRISNTVFAAAVDAGVGRLFFASSAVVYRGDRSRPTAESDPVLTPGDRPSGYAWSKLTDEAVSGWWTATGALEAVGGRFSNVYGPGGSFDSSRSTVVHALIERMAAADPGAEVDVWGDGSAVRSFVYVEDCAGAVVTILEQGDAGAVYNVDGGRPISIADLAALVRDAVEPTLRLRFDPTKPSGVPYRVLDIARLRSLGFEPAVTLEEGIRRTVAAYRAAAG
jgi:GDP-L-fucose synthase